MKIEHFSLNEIQEKVVPSRDTILISLSEPYYKITIKEGYRDVLYVKFSDISVEFKDPAREYILFNENHAKEILTFVAKYLFIPKLYIHCHAGISRATAVTVALQEILTGKFIGEERGYRLYNKHIYKCILDANEKFKILKDKRSI